MEINKIAKKYIVLLVILASTFAVVGHAALPGAAFYDDFDDGVADGWAVGQGEWSVISKTSSLVASVKTFIGERKWVDVKGTYCQTNPDVYGIGLDLAQGGRMGSYIKGSNYDDFDATVDAVVLYSPTKEKEMAIIFRAQDFQNFYHLRWYTGYSEGDDHLELWKYVNGTAILLRQIKVDAMPVGTRAVFKLSAKGGQFEAQVLAKGGGASSSRRLSATDTTYTGGYFGFNTYHTSGCFDNVRIAS